MIEKGFSGQSSETLGHEKGKFPQICKIAATLIAQPSEQRLLPMLPHRCVELLRPYEVQLCSVVIPMQEALSSVPMRENLAFPAVCPSILETAVNEQSTKPLGTSAACTGKQWQILDIKLMQHIPL